MASIRKPPPSSTHSNKLVTPACPSEPAQKTLPVVPHKNRNDPFDSLRIHVSTERALIIRNKAGVPFLPGKISGQEKLALLANELMITAIRPRLDIDELFRIADSQLWLQLSNLSNLKDPLFFYDDIMVAIESRFEYLPDKNGRKPDLMSDSPWIASVIGSRLHNLHLLAACWRVVKNVIKELKAMHLDVSEVHEQLARNIKLRDKYLLLYDVVTTLARMGQQHLANIAAVTPHYVGYFHLRNGVSGQAETKAQIEFNRQNPDSRQLRQAHKSFIDAIVLEVVLPNSQYPPHILMTLLRDALDECKKEEVRFSQALWDAIGDFSVATKALDMIEGPLLSEQGDSWLKNSTLSREYVELLDMQESSQDVIKHTSAWGTCFRRLIDTKDKACLDLLWKTINESYRKFTGRTPEALWSLQGELQRSPQWSYTFNADVESDVSEDLDRALVVRPTGKSKTTRGADIPRITSGNPVYDDDEIPALTEMSDTEDDADYINASVQSYDSGDDYESDYDESEDELYQDDLREALNQMDNLILDDADSELQKKSSNSFVKMFANLRGRFVTANPTLAFNRQDRRPSVKHVYLETAQLPTKSNGELSGPPKPPKPPGVKVEDIEDEEDIHPDRKKKKKKKKKKKISQDQALLSKPEHEENEEASDMSPKPSMAPVQTVIPAQSTPSVKLPESPQSRISSPGQISSPSKPKATPNKSDKPLLEFNYTQIALPTPETAQSARSYLQAESLISEKSKIKSRPAFPSMFFRSPGENKEAKKVKDKEDKSNSKTRGFITKIKKINLPKKVGDLMHRLIGSADGKTHAKKTMKWDDFVKLMRAMGFTYNPSTAGSSVRFDAPHQGDPSVTFHKPHPDSTLQRHHLRDFGKTLTRTYGWREEMFNAFGIEENEESEGDEID